MTLTTPTLHGHKLTSAIETKVLDPGRGLVRAIVNVSGNRDSDGDVVVPGASSYGLALVNPKVVWSHDWKTPIGKSIQATEVYPGDPSLPGELLDAGLGGLRLEMQFNLKTQSGADAFANVDFYGDEQEWSVGYDIAKDGAFIGGGDPAEEAAMMRLVMEASDDHRYKAHIKSMMDGERTQYITKWTVYEGSPVLFGANRLAQTEDVKTADEKMIERIVVRALEKALGPAQTLHAPKGDVVDNDLFEKAAIATHSTATSTGTWDGPANERRVTSPNDSGLSYFKRIYAFRDDGQDPNVKASYRYIHHEVSGDGTPGAANMTACSTGIGVLNGGRGGTTIPTDARQGVYDHLAKHLRDGNREPPELKAIEDLPEKYAPLDDLEIGVAYLAGDLAEGTKTGRVLSGANVDRLRAVRDAITALLSGAGTEEPKIDDDGWDEKNDPPTAHAFEGDPEHPHRCVTCGAGAQRPWHQGSSSADDTPKVTTRDLMEFKLLAAQS